MSSVGLHLVHNGPEHAVAEYFAVGYVLEDACSICFKTKLPFVLAFNKTDVCSHAFAAEWPVTL